MRPDPDRSTSRLLCLNAGSSSLSAVLIDDGAEVWAAGVDLTAGGGVTVTGPDGASETLEVPDPSDFASTSVALLKRAGEAVPVHRIVHGGDAEASAAWLDDGEVSRLAALAPLAPIHQPVNLRLVEALSDARPGLRQVGVFDTAFHRTMPTVATALPVPDEGPFRGLRRYGFHGLSHEWVATILAREAPALRRVVSLHLSGGASACAIGDGRSVDTTMGATPLDGLMMGTRSGGVDAGALLYALGQGMDRDALAEMLWRGSGLKGVSGISADLRDILPARGARAETAVALYCRRAAKAVAEMAVSLGGLDGLVFTGGAGAEQPRIRARIAADLDWLGVSLDTAANDRDAAIASRADAPVEVRIIRPGEERMMARHARTLIDGDTT